VKAHGKSFRYNHDRKHWLHWPGSRWKADKTGIAFTKIRKLVSTTSKDEPPSTRRAVNKANFVYGVARMAAFDEMVATVASEWDANPFLLGTPDGVVNLRTGKLRRAEPADLISKSTSVAPARNSDCPQWKRFLAQSTGNDAAATTFLQQFMGYTLTGDTREDSLLFVCGPGGNGKTVFQNVITHILDEYATTASMDTFTSKMDQHSTHIAMLCGARLVTASETEHGRAWAESRVKQLTGRDPVTAHFMRQDNFTYIPQFKLLIVGNHKPELRNVDDAIKRRVNIVPFNHRPATPDRQLENKLKAEAPGILRWMIDGCLDWQKNGLVRPRAVREATSNYFSEQDLIAQWIAEKCVASPGDRQKFETVADLYSSWTDFATAAGERAGSKKAFSESLQQRGSLPDRRQQKRVYVGVRLRRYNTFRPLQRPRRTRPA
jgi:putative DNA primase/helicase